jgi:DNA segregation ATPase FtsK/SpoIIIE, S-DNA-T family
VNHEPFNRPPRLRPRWPQTAVTLPAAMPDERRRDDSGAVSSALLPLLAGLLLLYGSRDNPAALQMLLPLQAVTLLGSLLLLQRELGQRRKRRQEQQHERQQYEAAHREALRTLRRLHDHERAGRNYLDPPPHELLSIAGVGAQIRAPTARLWERRRGDDDLLTLRVGSGDMPAAAQLRSGAAEAAPLPPQLLTGVPICLPLRELGSVGIAGPADSARRLVGALLAQLLVWHAPADVQLAVFCTADTLTDWQWLRMAPHSRSDRHAADAAALLAAERRDGEWLAAWLLDQLSRRRDAGDAPAQLLSRTVIVCDGPQHIDELPALADVVRHGPAHAMTVIVICDDWTAIPADCAALLETDGLSARWTHAGQPWPTQPFRPDSLAAVDLQRLAVRLQRLQLRDTGSGNRIPAQVTLTELLPAAAAADNLQWPATPAAAWHHDVPIGALAEGRPLLLDLNEHRHGPHGMIAGATGAGKSVLLQTIIAALTVTHDPQRLHLLLIDFKGGAALAPFSRLPHCCGLVTDLESSLAERVLTAIAAELRRRKQLLRDAGAACGRHIENIADYRGLAAQAQLAPLANLLIVLDEFDELARHQPEFVSALVRVVKQGRSLGVHLLIASQQPSRVVSDEIRSQLSYFIALRLGSSEDSRDMLQRPDAAFLPGELPGRAYLRSGSELRLFQVARLSPSLPAVVEALCRRPAERAAAIWQPPLPTRLSLSDEQLSSDGYTVTVGLLDRPDLARYTPFTLDLRAGHLLIVGAAQSGKSTLIRLLVEGLCRRHAADQLWCYIIDGNGRLPAALRELPQVGAVIRPHERERMHALLTLLEREVARRRREQRHGPLMLLLIDGLAAWRDEQHDDPLDSQSERLLRLARIGHDAGLRLVISAERPADAPYRLTALLPQRLALRLADPADYLDLLGVRPGSLPLSAGRGLWRDDEQLRTVQLALPADPPLTVRDCAPTAGRAPVPAVAAERVSCAALPPAARSTAGLSIPLGLSHDPPGPAGMTLDSSNSHLLISGARRSGKSNLLLLIAQQLSALPDPPQIVLIDGPRRRLAAVRSRPGVRHYITTDQEAARFAAELDPHRPAHGTALTVILIDDYPQTREHLREQLGSAYPAENSLSARLTAIAGSPTRGCHLIVAGTITYCDDPLLRTLDAGRHGVLLWPHRFERGTRLLDTGLPLTLQAEHEPPPGRALLIADDEQRPLQLAEAAG